MLMYNILHLVLKWGITKKIFLLDNLNENISHNENKNTMHEIIIFYFTSHLFLYND